MPRGRCGHHEFCAAEQRRQWKRTWLRARHANELPGPPWKTRIENFDRILDEDLQFAEQIQRSVESPGFKGMTLNYQERRIYHWHEELDRRIARAGGRVPKGLRVEPLLEPCYET